MTFQLIRVPLKILLVLLIAGAIFTALYRFYSVASVLAFLSVVLIIFIWYTATIKETTLCLVVKRGKVLMMLRNKKKNDVHKNKYNGLGGRVEKGESHEKCVLREVMEEAQIKLTDYHYVGRVTFRNFGYKPGFEMMYAYVAYDYEGEIGECNEGDLTWVDKNTVLSLPLWEGDKYFIMHIIENEPFHLYLRYDKDKVASHKIKMK